ncbi:hypothetical protein KIL84_012375 [Mauremys mutica]|uniref:Uncharacterized protein n=1 Tax=Mauremys mutica TaxID=74926 RepID=A0A9D3XG02_9SAUR|nr:hypothetical protein KIL84_012375 [Mauremys mutica]
MFFSLVEIRYILELWLSLSSPPHPSPQTSGRMKSMSASQLLTVKYLVSDIVKKENKNSSASVHSIIHSAFLLTGLPLAFYSSMSTAAQQFPKIQTDITGLEIFNPLMPEFRVS